MTIDQLIELCQNRITYLNGVRASALRLGDLPQVNRIDMQVSESQTTLNLLLTLV